MNLPASNEMQRNPAPAEIGPMSWTDERVELLRDQRGTTNEELNELQEVFEHEIQGLRDDIREKVLRLIDVSKKGYNHVKSEALS